MARESIATVTTAEDEPLELLAGVSDEPEEEGSVQIALAGRELATATTRRLADDRYEVVSELAGTDGDTVRLELTVTSAGGRVTVAGKVGGATLEETDLDTLRSDPGQVQLAGPAPEVALPAAARESLAALGEAAEAADVEVAAKGKKKKGACAKCRAKCTAQFAVSMAGCGALPPPANAICGTAASGLYADCYWNDCKKHC